MKLQGVTVVFCLIVIPIIIVLSFYIQRQVDTIVLQTSYDAKLLDATHGAMSAFEINTANESLSSVADSLRSIITASNNVFITALATNLGMSNASKNLIQPYIPAVLYTLYDGYYIYTPTRTPIVLNDSHGNAVKVGDVGTKFENGNYIYISDATEPVDGSWDPEIPDVHKQDYGQVLYRLPKDNEDDPTEVPKYTVEPSVAEVKLDYVLKSYMPYSARYKKNIDENNEIDIVVNYTLDNYIIINGTIDGVYYSKSGYLIDKDLIEDMKVTGIGKEELLSYNEEKVNEIIDGMGGRLNY